MRLRRGAIAALPLLLLAATALRATDGSPYGFNVHAPGGAVLAQQTAALQHAGVGWIRIDFVWANIEQERDVYDWSLYDALVQSARQRGLSILAIAGYTPQWATDGPELDGPPRDPGDWQRFVGKAAARYAGRIGAWEMWNEPNQFKFWAGSRQQYIDDILKPGADAVHAADPAAQVAGPALAHLQSDDWSHWLLDTLQQAGDHLDVVTHHLYSNSGYADVTTKLDGSTPFGSRPDFWSFSPPSVREVLELAHARDKPFWLTETGWQSGVVGESGQATNYSGILQDWLGGGSAHTWVQKIFFYEIEDSTPDLSWGALRADGSAKPAWSALADFIAAHGSAPPPPQDPPPLPLLDGRFTVQATWRTSDGTTGVGTPIPFSRESGRFWFFTPGNTELLVKVLDGSSINQHAWVYWGALSDVEYWITVTDTETNKTRTYHNPAGTLCGGADVNAFALASGASAAATSAMIELPGSDVVGGAATAPCAADAQTLCLGDGGRFRVQARWNDAHDHWSGNANATGADQFSGSFWFFSPSNLELTVKVLDGRPINGKFWVYFGAMSDVEYWVTVTDTQTGATRTYHNAAGRLCGQGDVRAF